jgi:hypothetical protein
MFARLTSGEEMPAAEKIRLPRRQYGAGPGGRGRPRREPSRRRILATERAGRAFRFARVTLCVLAVVASLIGFTLAFNHGGHGGCPNARFAACTGQVASRTVSSHPGVLGGG